MPEITIRSFVWANGRNLVEDWLADQPADVRAQFFNIITALRDQPRDGWTRPDYGVLRREGRGLGEIRFKIRNVQYRPIGCFIGTRVFVILAFATERDSELDPKSTCRTAQNRRTEVLRRPQRMKDCDF
jgi:hypothetical protein